MEGRPAKDGGASGIGKKEPEGGSGPVEGGGDQGTKKQASTECRARRGFAEDGKSSRPVGQKRGGGTGQEDPVMSFRKEPSVDGRGRTGLSDSPEGENGTEDLGVRRTPE